MWPGSSGCWTPPTYVFSAMFLVDRDGVVQAVKVSGRGGLGVGGLEQLDEAWKLIKDSFTM